MQYKYQAIEYLQTEDGIPIYLFSAPSYETLNWAGIPRKEEKSGIETVGFQRSEDEKRLDKISNFLGSKENIIANPILCAARVLHRISFEPFEDQDLFVRAGVLSIEEPSYDNVPLVELLLAVENLLLCRLPRLINVEISEDRIAEFSRNLIEYDETDDKVSLDASLYEDEEDTSEEETIAISSESHIEDFFHAVKLRRIVIQRTGVSDSDEFEGFSKDMLKDYLRTATVVDGQHRLLGSQRLLEQTLETEDARRFQDELLNSGLSPDEVLRKTKEKFSRRLGIALIYSDNWAEHVFQFVVVNQKATPIKPALLGSIIATTLTNEEVNDITERLGRADIDVFDYRVVAFLDTSPSSPFRGLIKRGYEKTKEFDKKLDWSVTDRTVRIFRFLKGGKFFHAPRVDYAYNWRKKQLDDSGIVAEYEGQGFSSPYEYWSQPDGPWRDVYCNFWIVVRDTLASTDDDRNLGNVWGYPRQSNLFNDVYLSILSTDFFAYLTAGRGIPIDSVSQVRQLTAEWLEGAKKDYFARDWGLKGKGVKKSEGAVKRKWSENWYVYRETLYNRTPSTNSFCP